MRFSRLLLVYTGLFGEIALGLADNGSPAIRPYTTLKTVVLDLRAPVDTISFQSSSSSISGTTSSSTTSSSTTSPSTTSPSTTNPSTSEPLTTSPSTTSPITTSSSKAGPSIASSSSDVSANVTGGSSTVQASSTNGGSPNSSPNPKPTVRPPSSISIPLGPTNTQPTVVTSEAPPPQTSQSAGGPISQESFPPTTQSIPSVASAQISSDAVTLGTSAPPVTVPGTSVAGSSVAGPSVAGPSVTEPSVGATPPPQTSQDGGGSGGGGIGRPSSIGEPSKISSLEPTAGIEPTPSPSQPLTQTTPSSGASPTQSDGSSPTQSSGSSAASIAINGLNTSGKIGIIAGCGGAGLIVLCLFLSGCRSWRKQRKRVTATPPVGPFESQERLLRHGRHNSSPPMQQTPYSDVALPTAYSNASTLSHAASQSSSMYSSLKGGLKISNPYPIDPNTVYGTTTTATTTTTPAAMTPPSSSSAPRSYLHRQHPGPAPPLHQHPALRGGGGSSANFLGQAPQPQPTRSVSYSDDPTASSFSSVTLAPRSWTVYRGAGGEPLLVGVDDDDGHYDDGEDGGDLGGIGYARGYR